MPADADMAALYCLRYTEAQLQAFLDAALEASRESTTITRSFEGSSLTISAENAKQVALDLGAALKSKQAANANKDAVLTAAPWSTGVDFSSRQIE
jgi:hypothetical protein